MHSCKHDLAVTMHYYCTKNHKVNCAHNLSMLVNTQWQTEELLTMPEASFTAKYASF